LPVQVGGRFRAALTEVSLVPALPRVLLPALRTAPVGVAVAAGVDVVGARRDPTLLEVLLLRARLRPLLCLLALLRRQILGTALEIRPHLVLVPPVVGVVAIDVDVPVDVDVTITAAPGAAPDGGGGRAEGEPRDRAPPETSAVSVRCRRRIP